MTPTDDDTEDAPRIGTIGGAYPIPVMLQDIADSEDGPFTQGIFIGATDDGEIRVFVSCEGMLTANFLITKLNVWLLNEM